MHFDKLVEELVREWAPLVWLAPNEKFMPGDVTEFLQHVHAEKAKTKRKNTNNHDNDDNSEDEAIAYYDIDNEFSMILGQRLPNAWENRDKRMFNYIIDLPLGQYSSNWYLVTNDAIGKRENWFFFLFLNKIISVNFCR